MAVAALLQVAVWEPGYARQAQNNGASPGATTRSPETVIVTPSSSRLKPFDMKQCYEDGRGCQLATCVKTSTLEGSIVICQSHGNFFP